MIVNAAIFTCSICGETSINICSYCTKDACSNHRCERCKRCSDCCECEFPLSAEEPIAPEAVGVVVPEPVAAERAAESPQAAFPQAESMLPVFLTAAESSVFAEESMATEPRVFDASSVFAEEQDDESIDPLYREDSTEPGE